MDYKDNISEYKGILKVVVLPNGIKLAVPVNIVKRRLLSVSEKKERLHNALIDYISFNDNDFNQVIKKVLKDASSKSSSSYICDIDVKSFKYNYESLKKRGITNEQFIILCSKIPNLLTASLIQAYENFNYLKNQKIVNKEVLSKVLLGSEACDFPSLEEFIDYFMDYYNKHNEIPEMLDILLVKDSKINQLELRDRLVSVTTLGLMSDLSDEDKMFNAKKILRRDNYDTIVEADNRLFNDAVTGKIYDSFLETTDIFEAIKFPIYEKLSSYDENLFLKFEKIDKNIIENFINSLVMTQNKDRFTNKTERQKYLKNEICGRILYGIILDMFENADSIIIDTTTGDTLQSLIPDFVLKLQNGKGAEELEIFQNELAKYIERIDLEKVLKDVTKDQNELFDISDPIKNAAISLMLKVDPYSFDALRIDPTSLVKTRGENLENKYALEAKRRGYLFSEEEANEFKKGYVFLNKCNNKLDNYIHYLNNQIEIQKIPKEDKNKYLESVKIIIKNYIQTSSQEELYKIYRAVDLLLRTENEYLIQQDGAEELAKDIFDVDNTEFNNNDRILYCLYNVNRLAHDTIGITLGAELCNSNRLDLNLRKNNSTRIQSCIKAVRILSEFGLSQEEIYNLIDTRNFEKLFDNSISDAKKIAIIDNSRLTDLNTAPENLEKIVQYLNVLKVLSNRNKTEVERERIKNDKVIISKLSNSYTIFFETKNILQEELLNKMYSSIDTLVSSEVLNLRSLSDKQEFYKKMVL